MPRLFTFRITCLLLFLAPTSLWAQDPATLAEKQLEIPVFLTPGSQTIGGVLDSLNREYRINFSYVNSQIPLDQVITITQTSYRLDSLLSFIFTNHQVKFFPVYDQIVLVKKKDLDFVLETEVDTLGTLSETMPIIPLFDTQSGTFQIKTAKLLSEMAKIFTRESPLIDQLLAQSPDSTQQNEVTPDPIQTEDVEAKENFKTYHKVRKPLKKWFAWGLHMSPSKQLWQGRIEASPDTLTRTRNQYGSPDFAWEMGLRLILGLDKLSISTGLAYQFQQKRGRHHEYFINTVYPQLLQVNTFTYSEDYHNIQVPLQVGISDPDHQLKWYFQVGIFANYRFALSERSTFSVYRDQFFSNLSVNSQENANLSPYFDSNLEDIQAKPKKARPWSGGYTLSIGRNISLGQKYLLQVGPEFKMHVWSLYSPGAPIREYPLNVGLHLLFLKKNIPHQTP